MTDPRYRFLEYRRLRDAALGLLREDLAHLRAEMKGDNVKARLTGMAGRAARHNAGWLALLVGGGALLLARRQIGQAFAGKGETSDDTRSGAARRDEKQQSIDGNQPQKRGQ